MTDARMAALEAVVDAVRAWLNAQTTNAGNRAYRAMNDALAALDALPAPAQGETVEVWRHRSGEYQMVEPGSVQSAANGSIPNWRRLGTTLLPIRVEGGGE
jgi:hypothetical protein